MVRYALVLFGIAGGAAHLSAQSPQLTDTSSLLVTSGTGQVSLAPDYAILNLHVATRDTSASVAARKNSLQLKRVVDSLNSARLPSETIQVVAVSVQPNENLERGELVGYEAMAVVRVSLRTIDRLSTMLDVALRSGATGVEDIEFHSDREEAARQDALTQAFAAARTTAITLAHAAGLQLGPLVRLSTEPDYGRVSSSLAYSSVVNYRAVPITARDIRVTASVTATWRLVAAHR